MRNLLRILLLAAAFVLGTWAFGWWAVPAGALFWGLINPAGRRVAVRAALAASLGWALLLVVPALLGAPVLHFGAELAQSMAVPAWALVAAELIFPFVVAWGAATLGVAVRGGATPVSGH